jgi:hypothetical protein
MGRHGVGWNARRSALLRGLVGLCAFRSRLGLSLLLKEGKLAECFF